MLYETFSLLFLLKGTGAYLRPDNDFDIEGTIHIGNSFIRSLYKNFRNHGLRSRKQASDLSENVSNENVKANVEDIDTKQYWYRKTGDKRILVKDNSSESEEESKIQQTTEIPNEQKHSVKDHKSNEDFTPTTETKKSASNLTTIENYENKFKHEREDKNQPLENQPKRTIKNNVTIV